MTDLAKTFKALSDESRLRIFGIVLRSEELCVCDIEYVMKFTQTKVSRHLSYLKNAGLVEDRRQGLWILYRVAKPTDEARRKLIQYVETVLATHPAALEDVRRLKESINGGCCTGYACVRPETARLKGDARPVRMTESAGANGVKRPAGTNGATGLAGSRKVTGPTSRTRPGRKEA